MPLAGSRHSVKKAQEARKSLLSKKQAVKKERRPKVNSKRRSDLLTKKPFAISKSENSGNENSLLLSNFSAGKVDLASDGTKERRRGTADRKSMPSRADRSTLTNKQKKLVPPSNSTAQSDAVKQPSEGILTFSPPDQRANWNRERVEIEKRMSERDDRVQQCKDNGQLLIFSPNGTPYRDFAESIEVNDKGKEEPTAEVFEKKNGMLLAGSTKKPESNQALAVSAAQLAKDEAVEIQVFESEEIRALQTKIEHLTKANISLEAESRVNREEYQGLKDRLNQCREALAVSEEESKAHCSALRSERKKNEDTEQSLLQNVQSLESENASLTAQLSSTRNQVAALEKGLGAVSSERSEIAQELLSSKRRLDSAEAELNDRLAQCRQLEIDLERMQREHTDQRDRSEKSQREKEDNLLQLRREITDKESIASEITEKVVMMETELQHRSKALEVAQECLNKQKDIHVRYKEETEESICVLKSSIDELKDLNKKLTHELSLEKQAAKHLSNAKTEALTANSITLSALKEKECSLSSLEAQVHQLNLDLATKEGENADLAKTLFLERQKCQDVESRLATFDAREEELSQRLEESDKVRRHLHNRVLQLCGNIRVFVRVRPELEGEREKETNPPEKKVVSVSRKRKHGEVQAGLTPFHFPSLLGCSTPASPEDLSKSLVEIAEPPKDRGGLKERRKKWRFGFDRVFRQEHRQDDIWEAAEPLVQSTIDGYNVCFFAYGQTGSGKTFTMLGDHQNEGLIGRSVAKLFAAKGEIESLSKGKTSVLLSVELLEIYNETVRDLLAQGEGMGTTLKVTNSEAVGSVVASTSTKEEVMAILKMAQSRRCVRATKSNTESSRSHMIFTIHFELSGINGTSRKGKLHICDLAGSERLSKSGANAAEDSLRETKNINSSLSVLSNVMAKLQRGEKNVPFRESKLTLVLQNSLGGNSKTLAIVCCNPLSSHFHESLCSLRFADKVNNVDLKAVANFDY